MVLEGIAKRIKLCDWSFRMRLVDEEGTSHRLILTVDMLATMRNLAYTDTAREAATRKA